MPNKINKKYDEIDTYYVNKLSTISKEIRKELVLTPKKINLPDPNPTVIDYIMELNTDDYFEELGHFTISEDITFFKGAAVAPPVRNLTINVNESLQGKGLSKMLMFYNCVYYAKNTDIRSFDLMHIGADSSVGFWDQFMHDSRYYNRGTNLKIGRGQEKECTFLELCQYCGADEVIEFIDRRVSPGVLGGRKTKKTRKSKKKKTKKNKKF